jgi:hypothetical protein
MMQSVAIVNMAASNMAASTSALVCIRLLHRPSLQPRRRRRRRRWRAVAARLSAAGAGAAAQRAHLRGVRRWVAAGGVAKELEVRLSAPRPLQGRGVHPAADLALVHAACAVGRAGRFHRCVAPRGRSRSGYRGRWGWYRWWVDVGGCSDSCERGVRRLAVTAEARSLVVAPDKHCRRPQGIIQRPSSLATGSTTTCLDHQDLLPGS